MSSKGVFITFEGPDGSGKTTQIRMLADLLKAQGYSVVLTREPGGTPIGDQIRQVLFDLGNTEMHPRTEILLFQASRAQHVEELIKPSLAEGKIILCDRYADSTLAYQGYGHQTDLEQLKMIVHYATGGLQPDLTILLDLDAEEGIRRRNHGGEWNRLDAYQLAFHQRVRQGFHQLAKEDPQRWVIIDAVQPPEVVHAAVRDTVLKYLERQKTGS